MVEKNLMEIRNKNKAEKDLNPKKFNVSNFQLK